jgi:hypothetical protein
MTIYWPRSVAARLVLGVAIGFAVNMMMPCRSSGAQPAPKYFVIHCTAIDEPGKIQDEKFFERYFKRKQREKATNRGHGLLLPSGTFRQWWPFSKRDVEGTKTEFCSSTRQATYGTFINIEVAYHCERKPNPEAPTSAQYKGLAAVYAQVHALYGPLTIVSHKEVDRGLRGGHGDPYNFDFSAFYAELEKLNLDMSKIKRISNERHALPPRSTDSHFSPPRLEGPLVSENDRPDDCKSYPTRRR